MNTYAYAMSNPLKWTDPFGLEVTMTCRPVATAQALGINYPVHCGVIVWHEEEDECGNARRVVDNQYSLERDGTNPNDTNPNSDTYRDDRNAFNNGGDGVTNNDVPMPPIYRSQQDFDDAVSNNGDNYSQAPYDAYTGPNSNTSANSIIEQSGGNVPHVTGAWSGF